MCKTRIAPKFVNLDGQLTILINIHSLITFYRGVGTDEPLFNMNSGKLQASLDRVEAIFTHADEE